MRDLIEKASLGTPGRHKVYILDEVHMLSKAAEAAHWGLYALMLLVPALGAGVRVGLAVHGPATSLFVDRATCRVESP